MKKLIIAILALICAAAFAVDYTPVTQEAASSVTAAITVATGGSVVASGTGFVAATAQADTNATTTITGYTPVFVGQILIGQTGTGTNSVWVAKGITTNDWVKVSAQ